VARAARATVRLGWAFNIREKRGKIQAIIFCSVKNMEFSGEKSEAKPGGDRRFAWLRIGIVNRTFQPVTVNADRAER
jgi:hypothetical protein